MKNVLALSGSIRTDSTSERILRFVASTSGEHAYESLTLIMETLGAAIHESSTLLIKGAKSKLNAQGHVIDQEARRGLDTLIQSFI